MGAELDWDALLNFQAQPGQTVVRVPRMNSEPAALKPQRLAWHPGRWRIARSRITIGGMHGWSVTFPHTVNGLPRTQWRSTHAAAVELVDEATRERWPGA